MTYERDWEKILPTKTNLYWKVSNLVTLVPMDCNSEYKS